MQTVFKVFSEAIKKIEYKDYTLTYSSPIEMSDGLEFGRTGGWALHIRHKDEDGTVLNVSIEYYADMEEFYDSAYMIHNKDLNVLIETIIKEEREMLEMLERSF